eukprot:GHUV01040513.1.p1 GENE.GHUV01040513.1~~GHUV01040513.1.p1  ORF type:complete len:101 (+),score=0.62 GHUV01040513.1:576-878(+)
MHWPHSACCTQCSDTAPTHHNAFVNNTPAGNTGYSAPALAIQPRDTTCRSTIGFSRTIPTAQTPTSSVVKTTGCSNLALSVYLPPSLDRPGETINLQYER